MRRKRLFVSLLLMLFLKASFGQDIYQVGFSCASLEPDDRFVSLALAGYAAPWEGRFTIQWKKKGEIPSFTGIAGWKNDLYFVDGHSLFKGNPTDEFRPEKIGEAVGIRYIAIGGGKITGITSGGQIKRGDLTKKKVKWTDIGTTDRPVSAIAVSGDGLYLVDTEGEFWVTSLSSMQKKWEKAAFPILKDVVSLATVEGKLVALTKEGVLYQQGGEYQQGKWIKIGYKNGVTVVEDIKMIAVTDRHTYGIDGDNKLYEGEHRSRGELSASALSIKSGGKTVVIVGLDLTGINDSFTAMVKKELHKKRSLPPSAVFINSSHTHFAPVTQNWPTWQESNRIADSTYLYEFVREAIVKAVEESLDNAKPAELFFGRGRAQLGYNRSLRDRPDIYDDAVDVIRFRFLHDHSEGCLFMAACHPVFSESVERFTISANFPGVARKVIEEKKGISRTVFLQGTAGDINPLDNPEYITGEKLGTEVIEVLDRPMNQISGPISCFLDTIDIEVPLKSREEILAYTRDEAINSNAILAERNHTWGKIMLDYLQNGKKQFPMPVYVHTLNIGNWKLVGLSREATTPYSFRVKGLWPDKMISVAGYTNDVSSYLPTRLHIEKRNYEGLDSFYWYGMPDTFPLDVEERIISGIKKNNR